MSWYSIFIPDLVVKNYQELTVEALKKNHCELLLVDLDNTLAPYDEKSASQENSDFLAKIKAAGISVAIISNNKEKRVSLFCKDLKLRYYASALKPLPKVYRQILNDFKVEKEKVLCLGDQLLTDVLGAHLAKIKVVWCKPLVKRDIFYTKINRLIEQFLIKTLVKKGHLNEKL